MIHLLKRPSLSIPPSHDIPPPPSRDITERDQHIERQRRRSERIARVEPNSSSTRELVACIRQKKRRKELKIIGELNRAVRSTRASSPCWRSRVRGPLAYLPSSPRGGLSQAARARPRSVRRTRCNGKGPSLIFLPLVQTKLRHGGASRPSSRIRSFRLVRSPVSAQLLAAVSRRPGFSLAADF